MLKWLYVRVMWRGVFLRCQDSSQTLRQFCLLHIVTGARQSGQRNRWVCHMFAMKSGCSLQLTNSTDISPPSHRLPLLSVSSSSSGCCSLYPRWYDTWHSCMPLHSGGTDKLNIKTHLAGEAGIGGGGDRLPALTDSFGSCSHDPAFRCRGFGAAATCATGYAQQRAN